MAAAREWLEDGEYTYDNSETYKKVDASKWLVFWQHYEIVTGESAAKRDGNHFFACSC